MTRSVEVVSEEKKSEALSFGVRELVTAIAVTAALTGGGATLASRGPSVHVDPSGKLEDAQARVEVQLSTQGAQLAVMQAKQEAQASEAKIREDARAREMATLASSLSLLTAAVQEAGRDRYPRADATRDLSTLEKQIREHASSEGHPRTTSAVAELARRVSQLEADLREAKPPR